LRSRGFQVRRETLYRALAATEMPSNAALALAQGKLDVALFFSPRSAEIFASCVHRAGLGTKSMIAVCISENAAKALEKLAFSEIRIASAPDQNALLSCL
ncbi:MAG TPA: uroporphyrinogen-III synthase, partial [Rhizomicrobium sp.]